MEKDDKGSTMIRMGVSGWKFLLVPAYPGCPGSKAVKWSLYYCSHDRCLMTDRQRVLYAVLTVIATWFDSRLDDFVSLTRHISPSAHVCMWYFSIYVKKPAVLYRINFQLFLLSIWYVLYDRCLLLLLPSVLWEKKKKVKKTDKLNSIRKQSEESVESVLHLCLYLSRTYISASLVFSLQR